MDTCIIKSPLGFTKITGECNGIASVIGFNSEEQVSVKIPKGLNDCVPSL